MIVLRDKSVIVVSAKTAKDALSVIGNPDNLELLFRLDVTQNTKGIN